MSKQYRKSLGFTSASKFRDFFSAKDVFSINWDLVEIYNERLIEMFEKIQSTLPFKKKNIRSIVTKAYKTIRKNDILRGMVNNGRAPEKVYFSWMRGYISTQVFQPLLEQELNCNLIQNGTDDLSNPKIFSRSSEPDFIDENSDLYVEVQSGFKGSKIDIKKTKLKTDPVKSYYIACFDCFNGKYMILNTKDLLTIPEDQWYANPLWEGSLCYTVPETQLKSW